MTTATTYIFEGKESTLEELSEKHRIPVKTLERRLRHGISIEDAIRNNDKLTKEANRDRLGTHAKLYNVNGVDMTAKEVQKKYGINAATFIRRIERGMTPTTAAKKAVQKRKTNKNVEGYSDPTATKAIDNTESADITEPEVSNKLMVDGVEVHAGTIWKTKLAWVPYAFVMYINPTHALVMRCLDMNEDGFDKAHPNVNRDFIIDHYLVDPRYVNNLSEELFVSLETYMNKDNTSYEAYLNLSAYCPELAASVIRSDQRMISMFRKRLDEYRAKTVPSESQLEADEPAEDIESLKGEIEILIAGGQRLAGENVDLQNRILEIEQQLKYSQLIVDAQVAAYGRKTVEHNVGRYVLENRRGDSDEVE